MRIIWTIIVGTYVALSGVSGRTATSAELSSAVRTGLGNEYQGPVIGAFDPNKAHRPSFVPGEDEPFWRPQPAMLPQPASGRELIDRYLAPRANPEVDAAVRSGAYGKPRLHAVNRQRPAPNFVLPIQTAL